MLALPVTPVAVGPAPVAVHAAWAASATATRVRSLSVSGVPRGARVALRCRGGGCRFASTTMSAHGSSNVSLARAFRGARLRPGAKVDIRVTKTGAGGTLVRFTMRAGKPPTKLRLVLGSDGKPTPPGAPPPSAPGGGPASPGGPASVTAKAAAALHEAERYLGTSFVWGGATPATGFDDAGLVQYAYGQVGVTLPRVAYQQFAVGTPVALADLRPGDLVFFLDSTATVGHVGLALGDGRFIHAPHTGAVVGYDSLSTPYYAHTFAGGRRVAD